MYNSGASCYIGLADYSIEDNLNYLKLLKNLQINYVFSSFHINEAANTNEELKLIIDECNKLDLKLSLDVSKKAFDTLDNIDDIYSLRLDYGFSDEEIVKLSRIHKIELNASTIDHHKLDMLLEMGLDRNNVVLSFNFYPKKYTGHDLVTVDLKTQEFKKMGFKVACFIPSQRNFRPPLYEGLPTVEEHRSSPLYISIEELKLCGVDFIYFGDAIIGIEELFTLKLHETEEVLLPVGDYISDDNYDIFDKVYTNRRDYNSLMIRISSRCEHVDSFNTIDRSIGDITIDNYLFKRYCGEINIVLKDLEADSRVNVIGHLDTTEFILNKIKMGAKFRFI